MGTHANTRSTPSYGRGQIMAALSVAVVATSALLASAVSTADPEKSQVSSPQLADLHEQVNAIVGVAESELVWLDGINPEPGNVVSVQIPIDGEMRTLDLTPHSVRSDNYRLVVSGENGELVDVDPGPVRTLRGQIRGMEGSTAIGGLTTDGGLEVIFRTGDGRRFGIEQAATRVAGAAPQAHIVYDTDSLDGPGGTCGWSEEWQAENGEPYDPFLGEGLGGIAGEGVFSCAEIGIDADFPYYQDWGSDVGEVEARINLVIASVNEQYEQDVDITHLISIIVVRTSVGEDPYTTSDPFVLIDQFAATWNTPPESSFDRDVAHLFTGRNLTGTIIGIAITGTVCITGSAYGLVQSDCCGGLACAADLSAHELGHNWNAGHCVCLSYTMNATQVTCNQQFHPTFTIPTIEIFRNSRTCLDECSGATTPLPFFDDFPNLSFDTGKWITLGLFAPAINDEGINEPSPPFSMDVSGFSEVTTLRMDTSGVVELSVSYWWERTGGGNEPEPDEDLVIEYEDSSFTWVEVARHLGDGPAMTDYVFNSIDMPAGAFHPGFRLRFTNSSENPGFDDFYVDDVAIDGIVAPSNNDCDDALLVGSDPTPYTTLGTNTAGPSEAGACGFDLDNDIWFRFFALCEGEVTIDISGSDYNHAVAVYFNLGCPDGDNQAVACLEAPATSVTFPVSLGEPLRIRVGGLGTSEGSATMTITCDDEPVGCVEDCGTPADGEITVLDLLALLAQWGGAGSCDFDGGGVTVTDLLQMLAVWGSCP